MNAAKNAVRVGYKNCSMQCF
ncbi:hypothetical protein [Flavobacterium shii]